jgi:hypothetical protein
MSSIILERGGGNKEYQKKSWVLWAKSSSQKLSLSKTGIKTGAAQFLRAGEVPFSPFLENGAAQSPGRPSLQ